MRIKFEGQQSQIDANTLINVLIHYQNMINQVNIEMSGGAKEVHLQINAIEKGSFIIDISVVEDLIKKLFSSNNMSYVANLAAAVAGVFNLYKFFKGRLIKDDDKNKVEKIINNIHIEQSTIINIYNNKTVRKAISKSIETADGDEMIEGLSFEFESRPNIAFEKAEFKDYIYNVDEEETEPITIVENVDATLTIIALNFEKGSKWQFIYNGFKIVSIVKDDALMKKIDEGLRFGKGDAIKVKLKITKRFNKEYRTYENASYKIVEFYEHISAPKQGNIF